MKNRRASLISFRRSSSARGSAFLFPVAGFYQTATEIGEEVFAFAMKDCKSRDLGSQVLQCWVSRFAVLGSWFGAWECGF
jgi:hypothetical protein